MTQSVFPIRESDADTEQHPEVVAVQEAETLIEALSTDIGRQILTVLHNEAMPPSDIADAVDTSIQNVTYHLDQLQEAGLVAVTDTWYSSRGREMDVYAVKSDPITLCIGDVDRSPNSVIADDMPRP